MLATAAAAAAAPLLNLCLEEMEDRVLPLSWDGVRILWKVESLSESVEDVESTDCIDTTDSL